jgi:multiple sugar transport system permease protein
MKKSFAYLLLIFAAIPMLAPFLWMLATSLKDQTGAMAIPPQWLPNQLHFENYSDVADKFRFGLFTFNSLKISLLSTLGQLLSCSLAAYAFARMKFRGKEIIFYALLVTMMIPYQVTMIPVFYVIRLLGWVDSHNALIIPSFFGGTFGGAAFGTFLLRQFFETIPREMEDAATIDGAGKFRIYWDIFLPLSKPALATLGLFVFMGSWNDLLQPVIYLSSYDKMTLTVALAALQSSQETFQYNILMAGTVLSIIPILILFVFMQKYFVKGFVLSGIKG